MQINETWSPRITREEFINSYCDNSNTPQELVFENFHVVPCDCGEDNCEGWARVPKNYLSHNGVPSSIPDKYFLECGITPPEDRLNGSWMNNI